VSESGLEELDEEDGGGDDVGGLRDVLGKAVLLEEVCSNLFAEEDEKSAFAFEFRGGEKEMVSRRSSSTRRKIERRRGKLT